MQLSVDLPSSSIGAAAMREMFSRGVPPEKLQNIDAALVDHARRSFTRAFDRHRPLFDRLGVTWRRAVRLEIGDDMYVVQPSALASLNVSSMLRTDCVHFFRKAASRHANRHSTTGMGCAGGALRM